MGPGSDGDDPNDTASSQPLMEQKTPTAKRQRFTTSTQTHQQTLTSPSSSNPPTLHAPSLPTLPFEIIVEILQWLPVKFLLQLRCVCKSWNSLISDPQFAKKHLRYSPTVTNLVVSFVSPSREFTLRSYPLPSVCNAVTVTPTQLRHPLNIRKRFDFIVGSCDGILCFSINQNCALLWNPSIGKFKELPPVDYQLTEGSFRIYDMRSFTAYGFGYDRLADRYKVVAVFCYKGDNDGARVYKTQVKVLTLGTDSWRRIQEFPSGRVPSDKSGKFVSGTLNWLQSAASSYARVIVSLDLGKESYQELLQPDYGGVAVVASTLGVLRDCLSILSHCGTFSDIWLMKDYGNRESWTKLFRIPHIGNPATFPYAQALFISEDDQVLLEFMSQIFAYNSRNGTFKVVYSSRNGNFTVPMFQKVVSWMVPAVYIESLISPCS